MPVGSLVFLSFLPSTELAVDAAEERRERNKSEKTPFEGGGTGPQTLRACWACTLTAFICGGWMEMVWIAYGRMDRLVMMGDGVYLYCGAKKQARSKLPTTR